MDWELYERYRSTLLLAGLLLISTFLLAFHRSATVRYLQAFLVRFALPPQRILNQNAERIVTPTPVPPTLLADGTSLEVSVPRDDELRPVTENIRKIQVLEEENARLHRVLDLRKAKWPRAIPAHVVGRDPQRWFQEIVLDKGKEDGIDIDYSVLAEVEGREVLIGRITEVSAHVAKVMLVQDPLSAVAATVVGPEGEDGVVEGTNSHELVLKYLDRGSQVKIGDLVVTSGLGELFPPGVPIGWVQDLTPDSRQMFLQATLKPYAKSNVLRTVLVIATGSPNE